MAALLLTSCTSVDEKDLRDEIIQVYEAEIELLGTEIEADPANMDLRAAQASYLCRLDRIEEAIAVLECSGQDALRKSPNASLLYGFCLLSDSRYEEAKTAFLRVRRSDAEARAKASACLGLGAIAEETGDLAQARKYYTEASVHMPGLKDEAALLKEQLQTPEPVYLPEEDQELEERTNALREYLKDQGKDSEKSKHEAP